MSNTLAFPFPTTPLAILFIAIVLTGSAFRELLPPSTLLRRRWRTRLTLLLVPALLIVGVGLGARLLATAMPIFQSEIALASVVPPPTAVLVPTSAPSAVAPTNALPGPTATVDAPPLAAGVPTAPPSLPPAVSGNATSAPTIMPSRTPSGIASTPQNVIRIIEGVRSGALVGRIQYSNDTVATIQFRFATLAGQREPTTFASTTTYQATTGTRTDQRIVVGNRAWTRAADQSWNPSTAQNPQQEIEAFLPPVGSLLAATSDANGVFVWYDSRRDAELRLELDPSTGTPSRLTQTSRSTGTILSVQYQGWNTPESITPPTGQ